MEPLMETQKEDAQKRKRGREGHFRNFKIILLLTIVYSTDNFLSPTIKFIIFWNFLMVEQVFISPQVKRSVIIGINWYIPVVSHVVKRLKYDSEKPQNFMVLLPSAEMKILSVPEKIFRKIEIETFPYLEFVSNIFWMAVDFLRNSKI